MVLSLVNERIGAVLESLGLERRLGVATMSSRPDLSDMQCSGALQGAKALKRRPLDLAAEMRAALARLDIFSEVSVAGPGFVNLKLSDAFILDTLRDEALAARRREPAQTIVIDYGGPNVAKPLHVGHLRSAIIGEALKRIARALGHEVIADIHLGDWGTPMGMLLAYLADAHPDWAYFRADFTEDSAAPTPPLSAEDLNRLYPLAAARFKADEAFADQAREATAKLQAGHPGYRRLWRHFVATSVENIKKDFGALDVGFDLWLGESDAAADAQHIVEELTLSGVAKESQGALVIDVARPGDKYEVPPLILRKKDGAAAYATTDLATIYQRVRDYQPDAILYVVDQRQQLHFMQVFRAAGAAGLISEDCLEHIGFGTMNGKDGKPFKTRDGGVMRLTDLIRSAIEQARKEAGFPDERQDPEVEDMIDKVAIAAIKFGDLSNLRTTDYVFDLAEFVRFDGRTGPYIQYAAVRADAILEKAYPSARAASAATTFATPTERTLALSLLGLPDAMERAFDKRLPSELCEYLYGLAQRFNAFYRDCPILTEEDQALKSFRLFLTQRTAETLKAGLACLAIPVPRKMLRAPKAETPPEVAV